MTGGRGIAAQYFQALQNRNFSAAEDLLSKFREKAGGEEHGRGYACAMEGLLLSAKSNNDRYLYYKRLVADRELLPDSGRSCKRRITEFGVLNPEFDKGFFSCWLDFLRRVESNLAQPSKSLPRRQ